MTEYAWVALVGWALVALGTLGVTLWLARRSRKGSRLCPLCDYDLSATEGLTCPECGKTAKSERALRRRRRNGAWARLGLLAVALGAGTLVFNPGRGDGWASSPPDWLIWPLMPLVDRYADDWLNAYEAARLALPVAAVTDDALAPRRWERLLAARRFVREMREGAASGGGVAAAAVKASGAKYTGWSRVRSGRSKHGVAPGYVAHEVLNTFERVSDSEVRTALLDQLALFSPLDDADVQRLRRLLDSANPEVWDVAFPILRRSVADGRLLTPEILIGLERLSSKGRAEFLRELYDLVPLERAVIEKVVGLQSSDPDQMVRVRAGAVVWRNEALTAPK